MNCVALNRQGLRVVYRHTFCARVVLQIAYSDDFRIAYHLNIAEIRECGSVKHPGCRLAHYAAVLMCQCSLCMTSVLL